MVAMFPLTLDWPTWSTGVGTPLREGNHGDTGYMSTLQLTLHGHIWLSSLVQCVPTSHWHIVRTNIGSRYALNIGARTVGAIVVWNHICVSWSTRGDHHCVVRDTAALCGGRHHVSTHHNNQWSPVVCVSRTAPHHKHCCSDTRLWSHWH